MRSDGLAHSIESSYTRATDSCMAKRMLRNSPCSEQSGDFQAGDAREAAGEVLHLVASSSSTRRQLH